MFTKIVVWHSSLCLLLCVEHVKSLFFTDTILCPECSQPFISSCSRCGINKVVYTIDTTMRCNHLDRVDSKETQCFFVLTPEAIIYLMYENSFDSFFCLSFSITNG